MKNYLIVDLDEIKKKFDAEVERRKSTFASYVPYRDALFVRISDSLMVLASGTESASDGDWSLSWAYMPNIGATPCVFRFYDKDYDEQSHLRLTKHMKIIATVGSEELEGVPVIPEQEFIYVNDESENGYHEPLNTWDRLIKGEFGRIVTTDEGVVRLD